MQTEKIPNRCPKCQAPLPADAPEGLCTQCLLAAAAAPAPSGQPAGQTPIPPAFAAVVAAFPQLEIIELIGHGSMGVVYKARQPRLDRLVALKLLPKPLAAEAGFAERFNREARTLARLNHPNIVAVHDFGQSGGFFYLVMEFVDGVSLRQAMHAGRFGPQQTLALMPKICEALQFAHDEGILHRDIKPENILLDTRGRVKIADFGLAKLVGEAKEKPTLTASGIAMLTLSRCWRRIALVVLGLGLAAAVFISVMLIYSPEHGSVSVPGFTSHLPVTQMPRLAATAAVFLALWLGVPCYLLMSARGKALFGLAKPK